MKDITNSYEYKLSENGHNLAERIYKNYYGNNIKIFTTTKDNTLDKLFDFRLSIDAIIQVYFDDKKIKSMHDEIPLSITFGERFRGIEYLPWQDLTITEYSYNSGCISELYKLNSERFLYGYIDSKNIIQCIIVDSPKLKELFLHKKIRYQIKRKGNDRNQSFISFDFNELYKHNLILYEYIDNKYLNNIKNKCPELFEKISSRNHITKHLNIEPLKTNQIYL